MSNLISGNGACLCGKVKMSVKSMSTSVGACHCSMRYIVQRSMECIALQQTVRIRSNKPVFAPHNFHARTCMQVKIAKYTINEHSSSKHVQASEMLWQARAGSWRQARRRSEIGHWDLDIGHFAPCRVRASKCIMSLGAPVIVLVYSDGRSCLKELARI